MESKLLPCPFCEESAKEINETFTLEGIMHAIQCMSCECKTDYFPDLKTAIDIWNTRTNKDAKAMAELKEYLTGEVKEWQSSNQSFNLGDPIYIDGLKFVLDKIKELQGE
jgi:Lar family restriction alleviation protein